MFKHVAVNVVAFLIFVASTTWGQEVNREKLDLDLSYAVINQDKLKVRDLLGQGADPNSTETNGSSSPLREAVKKGNLSIVKMLVEAGADVNATHPRQRRSVIADAAEVRMPPGAAEKVVRYLLSVGGTPDAQSLSAAASSGNIEVVRLLLDKGISPDEGLTAASAAGQVEVVELLLKAGADVDGNPDHSPLAAAASHGQEDVVAKLLSAGADRNAADSRGNTPLHHAIAGASPLPVVKQIVNEGGRVDLANNEGLTAIRAASVRGLVEVYDWMLMKSGGKEPAPSNIQDHETLETAVLISRLRVPDELTRKAAQRLLVGRGESIIPNLLREVNGHDLDGPTGNLLAAMGPRANAAIPYLDSLLDDEEQVFGVLVTLNRMGPGNIEQLPTASKVRAAEALAKGIHKNKRDVYGPFLMDLLVGLGPDATPQLLQLLEEEDPGLRALSAEPLKHAAFVDDRLQAELLEILKEDPLVALRRHAARGLANPRFHSDEAKRALIEVLATPPIALHAEVMLNASAKERSQRNFESKAVEDLLNDASRALATYGPEIILEIRDEFANADEPTRANYENVYEHFGGNSEALASFAKLLDDPNDAVRKAAHDQIASLAASNCNDAGDLLIERYSSGDVRVKREAAEAISRISMGPHAKRYIPDQLSILDDSSMELKIRMRSLESALRTDTEFTKESEEVVRFVPELIDALGKGDYLSQLQAMTLLGQLGASAASAKEALETNVNKPLPERPATLPKVIRPGIDNQPGSDAHKYAVEQGNARMLRQEAAAALRRINADMVD